MTLGTPASTRASSRRRTHDVGQFIRETPGSQSLERGLLLLRAFRLGTTVLTNAELAERVGLPRPTVSRLTRSLVDSGFLAFDMKKRAYRLTVVFLSLACVFRNDVPVLDLALPFMRKVADGESINVGLAIDDKLEIVYLESVRKSRRGVFRRIFPGSRIPMELTSLGRAYLSALAPAARQQVLRQIASKYSHGWHKVETQVAQAIALIAKKGYCVAEWQPGMVAIAAPLKGPNRMHYAVNISFPISDDEGADAQIRRYAPMLVQLTKDIASAWQGLETERPESASGTWGR